LIAWNFCENGQTQFLGDKMFGEESGLVGLLVKKGVVDFSRSLEISKTNTEQHGITL